MIAFWVGMFAVAMLFLMCVPTPKWSGRNLHEPPTGQIKPPGAHIGGCYSGRTPKGGSGQSK